MQKNRCGKERNRKIIFFEELKKRKRMETSKRWRFYTQENRGQGGGKEMEEKKGLLWRF